MKLLLAAAQGVDLRVGGRPSTPQFHDRLWFSPSQLSSPLSRCVCGLETRSRRVKPSCGDEVDRGDRPACGGLVEVG